MGWLHAREAQMHVKYMRTHVYTLSFSPRASTTTYIEIALQLRGITRVRRDAGWGTPLGGIKCESAVCSKAAQCVQAACHQESGGL